MEVPQLKEQKAAKKTTSGKATKKAENSQNKLYATGRRKSSVARVWLQRGKGKIIINGRNMVDYFPRPAYQVAVNKPFTVTNTQGEFDVICTVKGGGLTGQAGAILHGIARVLDQVSEDNRPLLKTEGLLTRDSRVVERKKYGKPKARKSSQFSKR